jgi:hypothetical protein
VATHVESLLEMLPAGQPEGSSVNVKAARGGLAALLARLREQPAS